MKGGAVVYEAAPIEVFGTSAGAALYRKRMLEEVPFDGSFFAYYEDVVVAWRARMRGWRCMYAPAAVVAHHHSATARHASPLKYYWSGATGSASSRGMRPAPSFDGTASRCWSSIWATSATRWPGIAPSRPSGAGWTACAGGAWTGAPAQPLDVQSSFGRFWASARLRAARQGGDKRANTRSLLCRQGRSDVVREA